MNVFGKMNQTTLIFTVIVIFLVLSFLSCSSDHCQKGENLKTFYYPPENLKHPKIYQFSSHDNPNLPYNYWWIKSLTSRNKKYMISINFDQRFIPLQIGIEEITESGALMDQLAFVETDSISQKLHLNPVKIIYDNLFPFCAEKQSGVFLYSIEWQNKDRHPYTYTLIRNRRYVKDTVIQKNNSDIPAKIFSVNDEIEIFEEGQGYAQPRIRGFEIYAEGKGLVQYMKAFDSSTILNYELDTIFDAGSFIRENGINFVEWEKVLDSFFVH